MTYTFPYSLGPSETPGCIKLLMLITFIASVATAIIDPLYTYFFGYPGIEYLFGLSTLGMRLYYLWQPVTTLFIQDLSLTGLSISYLIQLAFNLYILWVIGTDLVEKIGSAPFVYFYLISGAISSLLALLGPDRGLFVLGPYASLMAIFTFWTMLAPKNEILLFFILPVQVRWVFALLAGSIVLIALSHLDISAFLYYSSAILSGYLYGTVGWALNSPFEQLYPVDRFIYRLSDKVREYLPFKKTIRPTKIFDLKTGKPKMDDETFVDEMLTKIAKFGESSLSWSERKRLQEISEKKRKSQK